MNKVGNFGTQFYKNPDVNIVQLSDTHPRRIETGLEAIAYFKKTGDTTVTFKPIIKSRFSNVNDIIVSGQFKDIKRMFQEINTLLKEVGGNKAIAVIEYLQGNYPVSFSTNEILKSLNRTVTLIKR